MKRLTVFSSNGELLVNKDTGVVEVYQNCNDEISGIKRLDLEEYKKHYNVTEIPDQLDILDLGYWEKKKTQTRSDQILGRTEFYEEPAHDWREEVQQMRGFSKCVEGLDKEMAKFKITAAYLKEAYGLEMKDTGLADWIKDDIDQTPVELVDQYAEKYDLEKL